MALPIQPADLPRDPRAFAILAKSIFRELRASGYEERDVVALASELLDVVTCEVQERVGRRD